MLSNRQMKSAPCVIKSDDPRVRKCLEDFEAFLNCSDSFLRQDLYFNPLLNALLHGKSYTSPLGEYYVELPIERLYQVALKLIVAGHFKFLKKLPLENLIAFIEKSDGSIQQEVVFAIVKAQYRYKKHSRQVIFYSESCKKILRSITSISILQEAKKLIEEVGLSSLQLKQQSDFLEELIANLLSKEVDDSKPKRQKLDQEKSLFKVENTNASEARDIVEKTNSPKLVYSPRLFLPEVPELPELPEIDELDLSFFDIPLPASP